MNVTTFIDGSPAHPIVARVESPTPAWSIVTEGIDANSVNFYPGGTTAMFYVTSPLNVKIVMKPAIEIQSGVPFIVPANDNSWYHIPTNGRNTGVIKYSVSSTTIILARNDNWEVQQIALDLPSGFILNSFQNLPSTDEDEWYFYFKNNPSDITITMTTVPSEVFDIPSESGPSSVSPSENVPTNKPQSSGISGYPQWIATVCVLVATIVL